MRRTPRLTQDRLKALLDYDPSTGTFTRLVCCGRLGLAGAVPGWISDGYRKITLDGETFLSGRLAWFYVTGKWPCPEVDHRDQNPLNDRWENLREATRSQNCANQKKMARKSRFRGVTPRRGRWIAQGIVNGKQAYLGMFDTEESAAAAYQSATQKAFGDFARPDL